MSTSPQAGASPEHKEQHKEHAPHHEYSFLTKETAAMHTMHEIVKHFNSTEQGIKNYMHRHGITETKDMVQSPKHEWKAKEGAAAAHK